MFLFAGEDDPCIGGTQGFQSSLRLLKDVGYTNIRFKLFPHMRHETLHEEGNEEVMRSIVKWLDENIH